MLTVENLHPYQKKAVIHQCSMPSSMLWVCMGLGKQQPNSEPVLTPLGWKPIGEIVAGDYVIGSDGRPTSVIGVFPQGEQDVLKVTFTDGSWCHAGWEHLWYVQNPTQKAKGQVGHVMTTRQIMESGLVRKMGNRMEAYWHIPMVEPVQFATADLPVDPYHLGVILGDGTIAEGGSVSVCTDKEIIYNEGWNYLRDHESCDYVAYASVLGECQAIRSLGLNGKRSWEKFIPSMYMTSGISQRVALLQGLMDTDGSPIVKGGAEFSSTSEMLVDGVVQLTQSLGGTARKTGPRITNHQGGAGRPSWRVNVKLPGGLTPFRLKRKLVNWVRPTKYQPIRKFQTIELVGKEESTCIKVAAVNSLYVTRNYIVTHNTSITLTSIAHLLSQKFLRGVLIVAPIRVVRLVWRQEAEKWEHTKHLRFSVVAGTRDQRTRALLREADVYLINYENMQWLSETLQTYFISKNRQLPFNGLVWDEISKCKNSTTNRVKAVKKVLDNFDWITGLTGTPASNGYKDLHGQFLVVDKGERLGTSKTAFKTRYYKKAGPYKEIPYSDTEETIKNLIGDITLEMSAEDYNPLPDLIVNNVDIEMPEELRAQYDRMEDEFFLQLESGTNIEVFNQASLTNKCLQFSNGAIYPVPGVPIWESLHDLKLDALEEIIDEAQGNPILCSYAYRSDAERIMKRFKDIDPINLTECKSEHSLKTAMHRWKTGGCKLMIGHPACLHPDTQVLTERAGWVRIIDVEIDDRVFDGIEFVKHSGCHYSGYKDVITIFGITMTPDHKLLIGDEWVEAKDVRDTRENWCKAVREWETSACSESPVPVLRGSFRNDSAECNKEQQGDDGRRGSSGLHGIPLRKEHVFDLVDCGPRHRFLIRNAKGDMFISHNSMGHGIDGLQHNGNILVWFGLNWSLDLYEQFNARVRRQGQGKPVVCHRILMKDTLDQAQALALDDKARTQTSLRNAVKTYRQRKLG